MILCNIFLWSFQTKCGKFNRQFTWKRFRYSWNSIWYFLYFKIDTEFILIISGFASPSAASKEFVPIVPPGTEFQVLYDHVTGEPTHLYYPELDITLPIQYWRSKSSKFASHFKKPIPTSSALIFQALNR